MRGFSRRTRLNVGALIVVVAVAALLCVGAVAGHRIRRARLAAKAGREAQVAFTQRNWTEACRQYRRYLAVHSDDVGALNSFAEASLRVRPVEPESVHAAIAAYRRILLHRVADAEVSRTLAQLYVGIGDFAEAAHVCRQRLETDPADSVMELWLARAMLGRNKLNDAGTILERVVRRDSSQVDAYALLSSIALRKSGPDSRERASEWLADAVRHNPDSAAARAYRARFLRTEVNDIEAARAELELAEGLPPYSPDTVLLLAEEWMYLENPQRARAALSRIEFPGQERDARFDPELDRRTVRWFVLMGRLALLEGEPGPCSDLADRILAQVPAHARNSVLPTVVNLYLAGGRIEQAREAFTELEASSRKSGVSASPGSSETVPLLQAAVAAAQGKHYEAIAELESVVARLPRLAEAWKQLANCYEAAGRHDVAAESLSRYLQLMPNDAAARLELARLFSRFDAAQALSEARRAETALPGQLEPTLLRIHSEIQSAGDELADTDLSARLSAELESLTREHPRNSRIRILQAELALRQGRFADAVSELQRAREACDDRLAPAMTLADIWRRRGEFAQAEAICAAAVEAQPGLAQPRIALAETLLAAGRLHDAERALSVAVSSLQGEEATAARFAFARLLLAGQDRANGIRVLRELAKDRPDDVRPRLLLLEQPEIRVDQNDAMAIIEELKKIEGRKGSQWRFQQAKLWLEGQESREHGDDIASLLNYCVENNAGWNAPVLALGQFYERAGRVREAEATYRQALTLNSDNAEVSSRLLTLLKGQRRFAEAKEILDGSSETWALFSGHRVDVALGLGDADAAIHTLTARIADHPSDAVSRAKLASLLVAHRRDVEAARRLVNEAEQLAPDSLEVAAHRVYLAHAEGEQDEALALLDRLVLNRGDYGACRLRGEYLLFVGQSTQAEKNFIRLPALAGRPAQGLSDLAWFYRTIHQTEKEIAALEQAVHAEPENLGLRKALMTALLSSPDESQRRRGYLLIDELIREYPQDPDILLAQATRISQDDSPKAATKSMSLLNQVIELDPHRTDAHMQLIQLAQRLGQPDKALAYSIRGLGANPHSLELRLQRAGLELELANDAGARELAESVLASDPRNVAARNLLTMLAMRSGRFDEARTRNNEARTMNPRDESAMLLRAALLESSGDLDQAIAEMDAFGRNPDFKPGETFLLARAELYRKAGQFEQAAACLAEGAQREPDSLPVMAATFRLLASEGCYDEIEARLTRIRGQHPAEDELLTLAGTLFAAGGRQELLTTAQSAFGRAVELAPGRTDAHLGAARVAYRLEDWAAAERAYRRMLELEPYHRDAMNELAWTFGTKLDRTEEALSIADRALSRFPDDPFLLDTRGVLLESLGRLEEARTDLKRCLANTSDPAVRIEALLHLGRVCLAQGDSEMGRSRLQEAQELDKRYRVASPDQQEEIRRLLETTARGPISSSTR